ncbi:MAG TPA: LLM class flavin-dependent oxidoreductase [Micromonosporaceae bacterium]|nr:LLM class flavin-dependent oxidoreductase [Micromonosporaceae bacterium]
MKGRAAVRIGFVLPMGEDTRPGVPATTSEVLALADAVESAGFDSVWTFDHLLVQEDGKPPAGTWEAWTMLTAIAARTQRVGLGVLVSCTGFREPIITAKIAHTLHEISDGRLTLGLGAGWHKPEYRAFGIPFDHKIDRFEEAIQIIGALIRDGHSTFTGRYYRTVDAPLLPAVPGRSRPPVLVGGRGPRMLELIAQHADVWNTAWFGVPGDKFSAQRDAMRAACGKHGRDPDSLEVSVGVYVKADDAAADAPGVAPTEAAMRDAIVAWRATGVDEILVLLDPPTRPRLEMLAAAMAAASAGA